MLPAQELRLPSRLTVVKRVFAILCNAVGNCFKCCFSFSVGLWSIFVASFIIGKN